MVAVLRDDLDPEDEIVYPVISAASSKQQQQQQQGTSSETAVDVKNTKMKEARKATGVMHGNNGDDSGEDESGTINPAVTQDAELTDDKEDDTVSGANDDSPSVDVADCASVRAISAVSKKAALISAADVVVTDSEDEEEIKARHGSDVSADRF